MVQTRAQASKSAPKLPLAVARNRSATRRKAAKQHLSATQAISRKTYDARVKAHLAALTKHVSECSTCCSCGAIPLNPCSIFVNLLADFLLVHGVPPRVFTYVGVEDGKIIDLPCIRPTYLQTFRYTERVDIWYLLFLGLLHNFMYAPLPCGLQEKIARLNAADFPVLAPASMSPLVKQWCAQNVPRKLARKFQTWFHTATKMLNGLALANDDERVVATTGQVVYKWLTKYTFGDVTQYSTPIQPNHVDINTGMCEDEAILCARGLHFCSTIDEAKSFRHAFMDGRQFLVLVECLVVTPYVHCERRHKCVTQALWMSDKIVEDV